MVHASVSNCRVPVSVLSWQSKKIKRVVRSSFTAETCSLSTWEHLDWMLTKWEQMTHSDFEPVHCDQWKCVNRRSLVAEVWLHACRRATVSSVSLFVSLLCLSLHCTGVERKHICTHPCHAHPYSFVLRLPFSKHSSGPACVMQKLRISMSS